MPESFESMLAAMAEEAVSATRTPSAAAVRRRGRQRTTRNRMVASAMALGALGGAVAGGMATRIPTSPQIAVAPEATYSAPLPEASGSGAPGAATPVLVGPEGSPATGLWRRADGVSGYLIIFPSTGSGSPHYGEIGLSEPGSFPLCYGRLATTPVNSVYAISDVACGAGVPASLTLTYAAGATGGTLMLHVPASSGVPATDIPYTLEPAASAGLPQPTDSALLAGTWTSGSDTVTIQPDGLVRWSIQSHGSLQSGSGTVSGYADGGAIVTGACATGAGECAVLQLQVDATYDQLTVLSGYGPEVFGRTG
jgi:hypothetical protein